ncbi:sn-glycerol-3-phosphate ABC transporter ATP-binding protein UgpC [Jannaschia sp. Os4]|uniref:ABC transporter ATP-binding protein n=1 Tax=Jannaschia sp. Os4 TaxID=2807617 RepID=UPI001939DE90|nr:sn-glycerol-3-phosphate ABC transporter ATP-binding protein UgpC [Jannaschia sp. Os4]MBM2575570.1 sn-glycerol-3-phosphate ABC transporter ATP-binding protein UgpC [Jannaschia sp. Os4]
MPQIVFDGVRKSFGPTEVLPPLDLTLEDGEFTVLVGPSGCGKSTTLRLLAGLETLSGGEIRFDDRRIDTLEPKERDIAMVFQDYALYPHMSVAKNMSFALRLARENKAEIERRVHAAATTLGIDHLLDRKPAALSGGQRQRVAMGRALVRDASVFLFDEPLSNLDAKLRARMRVELGEMRTRIDKNMVYVTHDQVEAMTLGDRIVVLKDGAIQQQGSAEELFENPVNRFVAGFIGSPTMNFLPATIQERDGALVAEGEGFALPLAGPRQAIESGAREVEIGIRPSSFTTDMGAGAPVELRVSVAEYLGAQSVLVTRCGPHEVLAEVASTRRFKPGETATFAVPPDAILLFDRETGRRLAVPQHPTGG